MNLVPISRDQARAFVSQHHRHSGPPLTWRFGVGLERNGQLVGVGMAGNPMAREIAQRDPLAIEVLRVCTTEAADKNSCSRLYGALCRAATALGFCTAYTYTLEHEDGASLRASGFTIDGSVPARDFHNGRHRYQTNLLGEPIRPECGKVRWKRELRRPETRIMSPPHASTQRGTQPPRPPLQRGTL